MGALFNTILARVHGFFRSRSLDSDFDQELETHISMAAEDKIRRGMTPEDARRTARMELGGLTELREAGRAARGLPWLGTFALDTRLGLRMLGKSWGLTLLGGMAMAVAIGIGATAFVVLDTLEGNALPLDEGDRVVRLETHRAGGRDGNTVQDLEWWRKELRSVEDMGAFRTVERSLLTADGSDGRLSVAEMTASGFRLARVQPLVGRPLLEEDERDGAPPVAVIGYDIWRSRFSGDSAVVGQTVRIDGLDHVLVGVMPGDFGFPVNHEAWIPFQTGPLSTARRANADVMVFARLAPGATIEAAEAEMAVVGPAPGDPRNSEEWRIHVMPYADSFALVPWWFDYIPLFLVLLVLPPCANIAILLYARNLSRQEEFAARYVLGASRARIVGQLLIEAFVLAAAAGGVGLALTYEFVEGVQHFFDQEPNLRPYIPFWMQPDISYATVLYIVGLAAVAAMAAGMLPALRATGSMRQSAFHGLGNRTSPRLGRTWTVLVGIQVALSVAALPAAAEAGWFLLRLTVFGPGFAAGEYVTARIELEGEPSPARFGDLQARLVERMRTEPGVSGATLSAWLYDEEGGGTIQTDVDDTEPIGVRPNYVDAAFFDVMGASLLAGRRFEAADFSPGHTPVVVINRTLAEEFSDLSPVGRRMRYLGDPAPLGTPSEAVAEPGPWYEIIGIVEEIAPNAPRLRLYHPMAPGEIEPASLTLGVGPTIPPGLAGRLMEIARDLGSDLEVGQFRTLDDAAYQEDLRFFRIMGLGFAGVVLTLVVFAAAGIHTLVAFAVARRHREIGIRSAMGAPPSRLVAEAFRRDFVPVLGGAVVGALLAWRIDVSFNDGVSATAFVATAAFMVLVGVLSVAGPARRIVRIDPNEALREN